MDGLHTNGACHPGGQSWKYQTGTLSFHSIHCNPREDQMPGDEISGTMALFQYKDYL